jgi:hypothetical protein
MTLLRQPRNLFSGFAVSILFAFGLATSQGAYAQSKNLAPGFTTMPKSSKVVLMPIDVELFELTAGGSMEPKADWSANAEKFMKAALVGFKQKAGLNSMELSTAQADEFDELNALQGAVASSINIHHFGPATLPNKDGKLNWTLGEAVAPLHKATGADYGLFVWMRDSYSSGGRKLMMFLGAAAGVGISGGIQVGYASLIDLRTGQVVWFNRNISGFGDLREAEPAKLSIEALLSAFPSAR